jgi:hypothetical protein
MASIILAGTTVGTSLSLTGDTSGELQIQTNNGATTALTLTTGGAAVFTAGTVSDPAITTTGDTNTGIFFPAADTIAFTEGGVEAMRIDSSGRVGIGVTNPQSRLYVSSGATTLVASFQSTGTNTYTPTASTSLVNSTLQLIGGGASGATTGIRITQGSSFELFMGGVQESGGAAALVVQGFDGSAYVERMRITSASRMGLGTSSPVGRISAVNEGYSCYVAMASSAGSGLSVPVITATDLGAGNFATAIYDGFAHTWNTSNSARMYLTDAGNLGIGTSSPNQKLEVAGTMRASRAGTPTTFMEIFGGDASIDPRINVPTGFGIPFNINGTERMRMDSAGNFIVGDTSTVAKFKVFKNADSTEAAPHIEITGNGYAGFHFLDATAYYIGQNSASRSLRIYSSAETAGVNLAAGGTSWGTFSDERLKYDIEPITEGLNKLSNLRSVSYRLKDVDLPDSKKKLGVIAQDLVGVIDEVVDITKRSGDETEYMSVRYTELIPVLVKAIQELKAELDSVKAELQTLKGN